MGGIKKVGKGYLAASSFMRSGEERVSHRDKVKPYAQNTVKPRSQKGSDGGGGRGNTRFTGSKKKGGSGGEDRLHATPVSRSESSKSDKHGGGV